MNKNKLKLFVWTDFCPQYTYGFAFAIAKDETQARKLIVKHYDGNVYDWGDLKIYNLNSSRAFCVSGWRIK